MTGMLDKSLSWHECRYTWLGQQEHTHPYTLGTVISGGAKGSAKRAPAEQGPKAFPRSSLHATRPLLPAHALFRRRGRTSCSG
eukprot:532346-Pleurochrysis_carterae.AAC.1